MCVWVCAQILFQRVRAASCASAHLQLTLRGFARGCRNSFEFGIRCRDSVSVSVLLREVAGTFMSTHASECASDKKREFTLYPIQQTTTFNQPFEGVQEVFDTFPHGLTCLARWLECFMPRLVWLDDSDPGAPPSPLHFKETTWLSAKNGNATSQILRFEQWHRCLLRPHGGIEVCCALIDAMRHAWRLVQIAHWHCHPP